MWHGYHRFHVRLFVLACQVCVERSFVRFIKVGASSCVVGYAKVFEGGNLVVSIQRKSAVMELCVPLSSLIVHIHRPLDTRIQRSLDRLDGARDSGVDGLALLLGRPTEDVFHVSCPPLGSSDADAHAGELLGA